MNRLPLKLLLVTLLCDVAGLAFFFILSVNQFSSQLYEMVFRPAWIIDNTLIQFLQNITAFHCSAIVITYSFLYRKNFTSRDARNPEGPFYKLVLSSIVIILVFTLAASLLQEITVPGALARQFERRELTRISREIHKEAEAQESRGNYAEAYRLYKQYIEIFPEFRDDVKKAQERLEIRLADEEPAPQAAPAETGLRHLTPRELLGRAREYAEDQDYFSAYYYSSLAFRQDSTLADAREYATRMWSLIETTAPQREEILRSRVFDQKKRGTELLAAGKSVEAFYVFLALKDFIAGSSLPLDPDVETYIELARRESQDVAFFTQDVRRVETSPGYQGLLFLNAGPGEAGDKELIYLGKAVPHLPAQGCWMAKDLAVIRWNGRTISYSLRAPYGKILFSGSGGNQLILHGVDPDTRKAFSGPSYLEGRTRPELPELLPLNISQEQLDLAAEESQDYRMTSLPWLLEARKNIGPLGLLDMPLDRRILEKIFFPFGFLVLSIFSLAMGWRLRWRSGGPGGGNIAPVYWLLLPVLPFFFGRIVELYNSAFLLPLQSILALAGFLPALVVLLVTQGILLVLAFVILAGQSNK